MLFRQQEHTQRQSNASDVLPISAFAKDRLGIWWSVNAARGRQRPLSLSVVQQDLASGPRMSTSYENDNNIDRSPFRRSAVSVSDDEEHQVILLELAWPSQRPSHSHVQKMSSLLAQVPIQVHHRLRPRLSRRRPWPWSWSWTSVATVPAPTLIVSQVELRS